MNCLNIFEYGIFVFYANISESCPSSVVNQIGQSIKRRRRLTWKAIDAAQENRRSTGKISIHHAVTDISNLLSCDLHNQRRALRFSTRLSFYTDSCSIYLHYVNTRNIWNLSLLGDRVLVLRAHGRRHVPRHRNFLTNECRWWRGGDNIMMSTWRAMLQASKVAKI